MLWLDLMGRHVQRSIGDGCVWAGPGAGLRFGMAEPAQLAVVGEGTADGVPDRCIVHAALNVMADTVADAVSRVAALASRVLDSLKAAGLEPADIRTTGMNVTDFFDHAQQKVTARVASYQLEITFRQLENLGERLTGLVSVAGDSLQISALQLTISDPDPLKRAARLQAMNDARDKATQLAESAGGRLGRIVSIDEGSPGAPNRYRGFGRTMKASSAPVIPHLEVEPGSLTVSCRVEVTYELLDEFGR